MATCPPVCSEDAEESPASCMHAEAAVPACSGLTPTAELVDGSTCSIAPDVSTLTMQLHWSDLLAPPATLSEGGSVSKHPPTPAHRPVDLDLLAMLLDQDGNAMELVSFLQTHSADGGSVVLTSGDQRHGSVGEVLTVRLQQLPKYIATVAFVVLSPDTTVAVSDVPSVTLLARCNASDGKGTTQPERCLRYVCHSTPSEATTDPRSMRLIGSLVRCRTSGWTFGTHRQLLRGVTLADPLPAICRAIGLPPHGDVHFRFPLSLQKGDDLRIWTAPRGHVGDGGGTDDGSATLQRDDSNVLIGIGWDLGEGDTADVDLSCIAVNVARGEVVDMLYWAKLTACGEGLVHSGDNTTGAGEGIDERIAVRLSRLPLHVTAVVFSVSSYNTESLDALKNIFFVVGREKDEAELVRMECIGCGGAYSTYVPCALIRGKDSAWNLRVLSLTAPGKSVTDEALRTFMLQAVCNATSGSGSGSLIHQRLNLRRAALAHQRVHSSGGRNGMGQGAAMNGGAAAAMCHTAAAHSSRSCGSSAARDLRLLAVVVVCFVAFVLQQYVVR